MQEIKDSPDIDTDRPVSRQMESHLYDYYGWNPYWSTGPYMGGYGYMGGAVAACPSFPGNAGSELPRNIHFLVVDTTNWWPGKKMLIAPRSAQTRTRRRDR